MFLLEETGNPLSISQAWAYFNQQKFKQQATISNAINLNFVSNVYWLAVPVKNISGNIQNLLTGADNGGIFKIEYYLLQKANLKLR